MAMPSYAVERAQGIGTPCLSCTSICVLGDIQVFFISIRTRNGPTAPPLDLSTCDLLQVVANALKFRLIYDTWYFISYEKYEKRRFESM